MKYLFTDSSSVLLRMSTSDGSQPYTLIQSQHTPQLSVQLSLHKGFLSPLNWHMGAYLFLGLPGKQGGGFRSNGKMIKSLRCGYDRGSGGAGGDEGNDYFAFFTNPREQQVVVLPQKKTSSYVSGHNESANNSNKTNKSNNNNKSNNWDDNNNNDNNNNRNVCNNWRSTWKNFLSGRRMPLEMFVFTEVRFGGVCGCYSTSDKWMDTEWKAHGAAIGVR